LAAFTANRNSPSSLNATAPCDPSPAPVPLPRVAKEPAGVSDPSAVRLNAMTAFPAAELLSVNTAPTSEPPRDNAADPGTFALGEVASSEHAPRMTTRLTRRDTFNMTISPDGDVER